MDPSQTRWPLPQARVWHRQRRALCRAAKYMSTIWEEDTWHTSDYSSMSSDWSDEQSARQHIKGMWLRGRRAATKGWNRLADFSRGRRRAPS
ncbi:hypothetical protein MBLNU457_3125t1 [Dothideomycetes sp. NU457]